MSEQRNMLYNFIKDNVDWVSKVSASLLAARGLTLEQYSKALLKDTYRFDELALLLISRMLHCHTFVMMEGKYWCSRADLDVSKCIIKFLFMGELEFDFFECSASTATWLTESPSNTTTSGQLVHVTLKKEVKKEEKHEESKNGVAVKSRDGTTLEESLAESSDDDDFEIERPVVFKLKWKEHTSSSSSDDETQDTSTDSTARFPLKKRRGEMQTPTGNILVTKFFHKDKVRLKEYTCNQCNKKFNLQKDLDQHIGLKHKKWQCNYCDKEYTTSGGLHKHERSHENLANACTVCKKRFQFPYQVEKHARNHTACGLLQCKDCDLKFACQSTLDTHRLKHVTKLDCPQCDKKFNSTDTLAQHKRGEHGPGWISPCGQNFKWKSRCFRHANKCDECLDVRAEQEKARYLFR